MCRFSYTVERDAEHMLRQQLEAFGRISKAEVTC
jgi:hypothetical protein